MRPRSRRCSPRSSGRPRKSRRSSRSCNIDLGAFAAPDTGRTMDHDELIRRLTADLEDSYDEELEMEIEDRRPLPDDVDVPEQDKPGHDRRRYFRELFHLQGELVKLQDW